MHIFYGMVIKILKSQSVMLKKLAIVVLIGIAFSCKNETTSKEQTAVQSFTKDYTKYVNPFIGTSKMGHVFPGATAPFGMVQLSPQTNFEVIFHDDGKKNTKTYQYWAGYQYRDSMMM